MASVADFSKMVPGFDFLQGLMKTAGSGLPGMGQWVAPTLDPAELEKRIDELRTVQFWLEQNAKLLGGTIQALEVQRMTLSTLKTMNLPVADFSEAFKLKMPLAAEREPAATAEPAPKAPSRARARPSGKGARGEAAQATGPVDPMQWWGALTQQFTEIAAQAVKDSSAQAAKGVAGALGQQAADTALEAFKSVSAVPAQAMERASKATKEAPRRGRDSGRRR